MVMEIDNSKFNFCLSEQDLQQIRSAIRKWGKAENVCSDFNGARLYNHFETWSDFVEMNWADWDVAEYDHDIGCRYWIQVSIEHSTTKTQLALESAVAETDSKFKAKMNTAKRPNISKVSILSKHPYFWETQTIHPELAA
jgi:hypothetical protein